MCIRDREEAAQTAEYFGTHVERIYDVGVSGMHRLFSRLDTIQEANCVVAVAGMEGALASVMGLSLIHIYLHQSAGKRYHCGTYSSS